MLDSDLPTMRARPLRPALHVEHRSSRDAHVVPMGDVMDHVVTDAGFQDDPDPSAEEDWAVFVDDRRSGFATWCGCYPSVKVVRYGAAIHRVLIHHARDNRTSGNWDSGR